MMISLASHAQPEMMPMPLWDEPGDGFSRRA